MTRRSRSVGERLDRAIQKLFLLREKRWEQPLTPFEPPEREEGESLRAWEERKEQARQAWFNANIAWRVREDLEDARVLREAYMKMAEKGSEP